MSIRWLVVACCLGLTPLCLGAQTPTLTGFVTDTNGQPLRAAQVYFPGTSVGGLTDEDGRFVIAVPAQATELVVDLIGFHSVTRSVEDAVGASPLRISMEQEAISFPTAPPNTATFVRSHEIGEPSQFALRAAGGLTDFGLGLFQQVVADVSSGNVVLSPLGAALAFAVLQEGAIQETRAELLKGFGYESDEGSQFSRAISELYPFLVGDEVTFAAGSSIWSRGQRDLNRDFLRVAEETHRASAAEIDFDDPNDLARINAWASESTAGRIPSVIAAPVDPSLELLLLNAVYFKGLWELQFDTAHTEGAQFFRTPADSVTVPTMQRLMTLGYVAADEYAAVRLPYRGGRFASYLILPNEHASLSTTIDSLSATWVTAVVDQMRATRVRVLVPRVLHRNTRKLVDPLRRLGVQRVASPTQSQLDGLWENPGPRLFLSSASQHTYFRFDEEGTEAAAVTSLGIAITSAPPPPIVFEANRPFVILVRDDLTGTVLFVAAINDPTDEGA